MENQASVVPDIHGSNGGGADGYSSLARLATATAVADNGIALLAAAATAATATSGNTLLPNLTMPKTPTSGTTRPHKNKNNDVNDLVMPTRISRVPDNYESDDKRGLSTRILVGLAVQCGRAHGAWLEVGDRAGPMGRGE